MPLSKKNKVLHLARWYPNRYDPMPGLFIQRHVEAASNCCDVGVVYTHQVEEEQKANSTYNIVFDIISGVPTAKIYYCSSNLGFTPLKKIINILRFYKANYLGIKQVNKHLAGFDLIHVHILTRLGLIALYYKFIHGKPYIITEHWSRYLELTGSFNGVFRKIVTRIIVKYASYITAVTNNLVKAMKSHKLLNNNYIILPNVVDDVFLAEFDNTKKIVDKTVFVHVSCFEDKSKNVSGLLRVIKKLSETRNDFIFKLVGDGMDMDWLRDYSDKQGLTNKYVLFTGLLEGDKLVEQMATSDVLVIFSNYENFPVVINESLSLGVPVIATRVGGIPERINDSVGILVDAGNEDQLYASFINFLDNKASFNTNEIKQKARAEFSSVTVGIILCDLYSKALV